MSEGFWSRTINANKLWAISSSRLCNCPSAQVFSTAHTNQPLLRDPECLGVKEGGSLGGHLRLSSPRCCGHRHPLWVSWMGRWPEVDWKESRAVVCRTQSADAGSRSAIGYVPTSLQLFHLCDSLWETSGTASDWHVSSYRKLRKIKAPTRDNKMHFYAS